MMDRLTRNFHRCLTPTDPELRAPKDTKTRIVPCMYLVQKYGVPEDIDRDSVNMTTMGEFEFGECIFDGTRSFVEEDGIDLIKRFDHATLFHFLEMGMDTCIVFPQNIFP